jgi:Flp pilus assembly protein TadB
MTRARAGRPLIMRVCAMLACAGALLGLSAGPADAASASAPAPPGTVMILLDANSSGNWVGIARRAAVAYAGSLPANVRAGLIVFGSQWSLVLRPTTDRTSLEADIQAVHGAGGHYFDSEGLIQALTEVTAKVPGLHGPGSRLVVISDAKNLIPPVPTPAIPTDVIMQSLDGGDHISLLAGLASSSGGRQARPAGAAALAQNTFPSPATSRPAAGKTHRPQATAPGRSGSALPSWPWLLAIGLAALFVALLLVALAALASVTRSAQDRELTGRLERYGPKGKPGPADTEAIGAARAGRAAQDMAGRLMSSAAEDRLAQRLDLAGVARKPAEWLLLGGCLGIAIAAVLSLVTSYVLVGVLVGALAGWLTMRLTLSFRIVRRRAAFADQLPDVLQLVASALKSGFSLPQAVDAVVREDNQPLAGEFSRALAEVRLGGSLEGGLEAVANRMDCDDLRWTVIAIRIQQGIGGNLAEVLLTIAGTIRERAYLRRQVRALSAEGRLSAYILIALPVLVGIWLFISSPQYMSLLYTTRMGLAMLLAAVALLVVGALWMRKMIRIEI